MDNIIQIRKIDITLANQAFAELMEKTEKMMNDFSRLHVDVVKKKSSSDLECWSEQMIKKACESTPFSPNNVKLVSGNRFPDIVAESYYGVEVKSTNKDHWISTGSSIVESTRDVNVENIYMLFGKLGGVCPEFKCRPYESVLSDVAVTHSPRYLINMNLKENETIFAKMGMSYDDFRTSGNSIECVRRYYRKKAEKENKAEMPWWLTTENVEKTMGFNIRLWNTLEKEEQVDLLAKCMILFPEVMNPKQSSTKYHKVILWLCSYCQVVVPNVRDLFSAGGQICSVDGKLLDTKKPKIYKKIVDFSKKIKSLLQEPSLEMLELMKEFNPRLITQDKRYYENWLRLCEDLDEFDLKWIENESVLE